MRSCVGQFSIFLPSPSSSRACPHCQVAKAAKLAVRWRWTVIHDHILQALLITMPWYWKYIYVIVKATEAKYGLRNVSWGYLGASEVIFWYYCCIGNLKVSRRWNYVCVWTGWESWECRNELILNSGNQESINQINLLIQYLTRSIGFSDTWFQLAWFQFFCLGWWGELQLPFRWGIVW